MSDGGGMTDERKAFEAWVSAPPRERVVTRFAADAGAPWPGQYHDYKVQIAWDAWQESRRTAIEETREACARICEAEAGPGVDAWDCAAAIRRAGES